MKRKIILSMVLIVSMEGISGCQYTKKGANNVNIEIKKEDSEINKEEVEKESEINKEKVESETTNFQQDNQEVKTEPVYDNETKQIDKRREHIETYGSIEETRKEFFDEENGGMSYYYKMERFFVKDSFVNASSVNNTLKQIYDKCEAEYIQTSEIHSSSLHRLAMPYNFWHILNVAYAGSDYISLLYNDVYHMGGAHPYSRFDGITIDCATGEEIFASHFLQKSDEEILAEISNKMGFSQTVLSWDDIDFYIEDTSIVFFYRMPGFREDVVIQREK